VILACLWQTNGMILVRPLRSQIIQFLKTFMHAMQKLYSCLKMMMKFSLCFKITLVERKTLMLKVFIRVTKIALIQERSQEGLHSESKAQIFFRGPDPPSYAPALIK